MKGDVYREVCGIVFEGKPNAEEEIQKEMQICLLYNDMMTQLRSTKTFDEDRLQQLQDTIDAYCDAYILRHGNRDIYNYLHVIQAGHIRHQIRRFGNLFRYANVGFEAYIGTVRNKTEGMEAEREGQKRQMHARQKDMRLEQASMQWKQ